MIKNRDFLLSGENRYSDRSSEEYGNNASSQKSVWAEKRGLFLFSMY